MFVESFFSYVRGAYRAPRPTAIAAWVQPSRLREDWGVRVAACAARTHFLVTPAPAGVRATDASHAAARPHGASFRSAALGHLRRFGKMIARTALRVAYAGNPLSPGGYAILAMTVAAVALVAMLSTSSAGNELESALRLSWWFS
jgi:hypothetical protein